MRSYLPFRFLAQSVRLNDMPTIKDTNSDKMKAAMKAGDKVTTQFARNLHAAIRKKEVDDRKDLNDDEIIKLIGAMMKQREDSITQFRAGGREDLVASEEGEANYLKQYMPAQMSSDEVKAIVIQTISEVEAKDLKDLGKVMKALLPKVSGKADGKLVNQLVRECLGA